MRLPLFWKILLATLLPVVAFAILGITTNLLAHRAHGVARQAHYLARTESEAELGRRLIAIAQATAALLRVEDIAALQPGDEESRTYRRLQATLRKVASQAGVRRLYVFDRSRHSLCDSEGGVSIGAAYYHLTVELPLLEDVFGRGSGASMLFTGKDGIEYKAGFASLRNAEGRVVAALGVDGSADTFAHLRRLDSQLRTLRRGLWSPLHLGLLAGAGLLLLVLASLLLARGVTRPVGHLMRAAAAIGRGELQAPIHASSQDELGVLAEAMNRMRADLAARHEETQLMLSGIAHEVRNPLGGMELFAGLLADELGEEPERREMVERIQRELEYLKRVVHEFLDFARQSPPERVSFDAAAWTRELAELCQADASEAQVRLEVEAPGAVVAHGDPEKLRRALLNIARNAIQAAGPGGRVTLGVRKRGEDLVVSCKDTGPGIPPEALDKIFKPFYTTRERGTGLGLALAQQIVTAHGGVIEVDSTPGAGTELRLVIPSAEDGRPPVSPDGPDEAAPTSLARVEDGSKEL
ncbi:MAG: HAMP domain-containing sensor histidine kinase [Polyangia bacterium]|jgi:signal transduction histidine kinase|nr:HAMP domain-containing sensor histidine kinase [Polyangia bacterium]